MYYIAEEHESMLKRICGVNAEDPLPLPVQETYWRIKQLAQRVSASLSPMDLVYAALASGCADKVGDNLTFQDLVKRELVQVGDSIEVRWKGGKWVSGQFRGLAGDEVFVHMEDGETRKVHYGRCRRPVPAEA